MAKIGLVTVLYNSDEVLPGFFKSISSQKYKDYILYLIDNSANEKTDKLIEECLAKYPVSSVKHIKSSGNVGVATGNNTGIKESLNDNCTHVLFLNNDIELEQDFVFNKLLQTCEEKNEALVVPKIFYFDTRKLWMVGGYMDNWRALGVHEGYNKDDAPQYNIAKRITYAPTCFMLVKKEVFDKIGIMDDKYFAYYDDTDFVFRAMKAGFTMYYEPALYVLHKVSSSSGGDSGFYIYYSSRNKIYFIKKNLKGIQRYFSIFYLLISRIAFWLKYDKAGRKKLVQGIKDGFKMKL
jgi:GT2 family glycosyltransferase